MIDFPFDVGRLRTDDDELLSHADKSADLVNYGEHLVNCSSVKFGGNLIIFGLHLIRFGGILVNLGEHVFFI